MNSLIKQPVKARLALAIGHELTASNLDRNVALQLQGIGFFGAAKYFNKEAESELSHYQIIADYFNQRGDVAPIPTINAQTDKVDSLAKAFEISMAAEMMLETFYVELYEFCEDEGKDCVTAQFLLQFIEIQRKSIGEVKDIQARIALCGSNEAALLMIDKELGKM